MQPRARANALLFPLLLSLVLPALPSTAQGLVSTISIAELQLLTQRELATEATQMCQASLHLQQAAFLDLGRAIQAMDAFLRIARVARAKNGGTYPDWVRSLDVTMSAAMETKQFQAGIAQCLKDYRAFFPHEVPAPRMKPTPARAGR
jgi:hypothetical protein